MEIEDTPDRVSIGFPLGLALLLLLLLSTLGQASIFASILWIYNQRHSC
uniref:Uncharacterized protein n=1 Tax=Lotus japonicus TaxID=34305 RepID=I3SRA5_LOTJA|nr:unknown [Lotus japonicus]